MLTDYVAQVNPMIFMRCQANNRASSTPGSGACIGFNRLTQLLSGS